MNSRDLLLGRHYSGCAILWKNSILASVIPVESLSNRICAVKLIIDNEHILLDNVYMPYFSNTVAYIDNYKGVLAKIASMCCKENVSYIILGGGGRF